MICADLSSVTKVGNKKKKRYRSIQMAGIHGTATRLHLKMEKIYGSVNISKINTSCLEYTYTATKVFIQCS
jgi:hypothetical protein